jgi:hypothetical protein
VDAEGSEGGTLLGWECLGKEVGQVDGASDVGNTKLVLVHAAAGPVEARVNGFRLLGSDCLRRQPTRALVVTQDGRGGLGVSEAG